MSDDGIIEVPVVRGLPNLGALHSVVTMAGTLREGGGGSNMSNSSNYSSSSSSSTSSTSSSCTRIAPGSVIAVSPSHALDYDCTDCGSFLFGHRGRLRPRTHSLRNHHHSRVTSLSEAAQVSSSHHHTIPFPI